MGNRSFPRLLSFAFCFLPCFSQHHSAEDYARFLDDPTRDAWQKPDQVVRALKLQSTEVVADIGAGTGYFARRMARHAARIYAVDIDAKLLDIAKQNAPANLETILASLDDPKLAPQSVDTIFFCSVLHHIENRPAYYARLDKALKPGGRIVIIDFYKRPTPVGPPPAMKLSEEEVTAELKAAGFTLVKSHDFLPHQYFLVFERR
jgi:ubiquinone/menaquinone biosynthesis C-methylase UbiE